MVDFNGSTSRREWYELKGLRRLTVFTGRVGRRGRARGERPPTRKRRLRTESLHEPFPGEKVKVVEGVASQIRLPVQSQSSVRKRTREVLKVNGVGAVEIDLWDGRRLLPLELCDSTLSLDECRPRRVTVDLNIPSRPVVPLPLQGYVGLFIPKP